MNVDNDTCWWKPELLPTEDRGVMAFRAAEAIEDEQKGRYDQYLRHARMYTGCNLTHLYDYGHRFEPSPVVYDPASSGSAIAINVTQSCIEAGAAKLAKNKPRPLFLTSDGNWSQAKRARKLTTYNDGMFDRARVYQALRQMFIDSAVFGSGVGKVWGDKQNAVAAFDRVLPYEVLVDDQDGIYGDPSSAYHVKYAHPQALLEAFCPDDSEESQRKRKLIEGASKASPGGELRLARGKGMVRVVECWRRAGVKPGRHVIAVSGGHLVDEEFTKKRLPLVFYSIMPRLTGVWGQGWAEILVGIQVEINAILNRIKRSMELFAQPRVFVKPGALFQKLQNGVGKVYTVEDKPVFESPPAMSPDVYQHLWNLKKEAFAHVRLSEMSAASKLPAGVEAAVAMREHHDLEAEQFVLPGQRLEESALEISAKMIDASRDLYAHNQGLVVKAPGTKFLEEVKFSEVNLEEDCYTTRVFPSSLLPTQPSARLQTITEMVSSGFIEADFALSLFDFPDIDRVTNIKTAALEDVLRTMELITEHEEYETPDEYMGLDLAIKIGHATLLKSRAQGAPPKVISLLRRYIDDAKSMQTEIAPQQAQAQQAVQAGSLQPGADPMAAAGMQLPGSQMPATPALAQPV